MPYVSKQYLDRRLAALQFEEVSLKSFGAKGDGTTDDTTAWINAISYCATNNKTLFVEDGLYNIYNRAVIDGNVSQFIGVRIKGNSKATGVALHYAPHKCGATIRTFGNGAILVNFNTFYNESIFIDGVNFIDGSSNLSSTSAIEINKTGVGPYFRYVTNFIFSNIAVANYKKPILFVGGNQRIDNNSWLTNFYGPTVVNNYFPYKCGSGISFKDCTFNRLKIKDSLFFDLSEAGLELLTDNPITATGGLLYCSLDMVHFEGVKGCIRIPATLEMQIPNEKSFITLVDVTREYCGIGVTASNGFFTGDPFGIKSPTDISIVGRFDKTIAYGESDLISLPNNSSISSTHKVTFRKAALADFIEVLTPTTVTIL